MANKIEKIKDMIGYYFDWEGDTYNYFMEEIDRITEGKRDWTKERTKKDAKRSKTE